MRAITFVSAALALSTACVADLEGGDDDTGETDLVASGLRASRVALDFDVFGYRCPSGTVCRPEDEKCVCQSELDHLNAIRVMPDGTAVGHFLSVGGGARRSEVLEQGNRLSVHVNDMNAAWEEGGVARADAMMAWARAQFPAGVPEWFVLNEISRSRWLDTGDRGIRYRRYVVELARRLSVFHGKSVLVFSPFSRPGWAGRQVFPASWRAVSAHAYIGVEHYLSGALIRDNGFSEAFCRNRYQQSITAYTRLGVPLRRLMLTEHVGHTPAGTTWGRGGVPIDRWIRALTVRTRAARSLPFAGYLAYAWGGNRAHRPASEVIRAMDAYHRVGARRLALPAPSHSPSASSETSFEPSLDSEPEPSTEPDPDESATSDEPAPLLDDEPPGVDPPADDPAGGCDPPHSIDVGGRCVPSCGAALGNTCSSGTDGACDGLAPIESWDCPVCCYRDPASPPPAPMCVPRSCGAAYLDACGGAPDGCGGTLSCGDTCGTGLNCTATGVCKKALGQACAGPGQCASGLCHWVSLPGSAARCCNPLGAWCDSDGKCCGTSVCRGGRCVAP